MWNKFRLWFNRNDTKILTIAVIIIGIMILIKSTNIENLYQLTFDKQTNAKFIGKFGILLPQLRNLLNDT